MHDELYAWPYIQRPLQRLDRRQVGQPRAVSQETTDTEPTIDSAALDLYTRALLASLARKTDRKRTCTRWR